MSHISQDFSYTKRITRSEARTAVSSILDIQQSGSGFGWDDERKMVVGDKEQFMGWAKGIQGHAHVPYFFPITFIFC